MLKNEAGKQEMNRVKERKEVLLNEGRRAMTKLVVRLPMYIRSGTLMNTPKSLVSRPCRNPRFESETQQASATAPSNDCQPDGPEAASRLREQRD